VQEKKEKKNRRDKYRRENFEHDFGMRLFLFFFFLDEWTDDLTYTRVRV
jgi:hypothetical protein